MEKLSPANHATYLTTNYAAIREANGDQDDENEMENDGSDILSTPIKRKDDIPPEPNCCFLCCGIFSCFGVIFLLIIGIMLACNSMYLRTSLPKHKKSSSLAASVFGGASCYAVCIFISWYFYWRAKKIRKTYKRAFYTETQ